MLTPLYRGLAPLVLPYSFAAFSPLSLSPVVWYDFSDLSTLWQDTARTTPAVNDTDPVGGVTDKSGNGNHLSQSFSTKRPSLKLAIQNGRAVLRFDGVDDFLQKAFTLNQPWTIYLVGRLRSTSPGATWADGTSTNTGVLFDNAGDGRLCLYAGATLTDGVIGTSAFRICRAVFNGASSSGRLDNLTASTGSAGAANPGGVTLGIRGSGVSNAAAIDIGEVVAFNLSIAATDDASMLTYLNNHWAVY